MSFIWGIADDCLRDVYVRGKYRDVILPMTVIRRLDAVLEDTKGEVLKMKEGLDRSGIINPNEALCKAARQAFCNWSEFHLKYLASRASQQRLKADFLAYLEGFSPNVQVILKKFKFHVQVDTMADADILGAVIGKFVSPTMNLSPYPVLDDLGGIRLPALDNHTMGVIFEELIKQLVGDARGPIQCAPGRPLRTDDECVRNGVAEILMGAEPLAGKRHVAATERRTRKDWAMQIKRMLGERCPDAIKVRLVLDNLNTHSAASLYETFEPSEARRLAERLGIHYAPKHGSWLSMAEIELSALKGQRLGRRTPDMATIQAELAAWEKVRNNSMKKISWQFTTSDARIKLKKLYPKI